MKTIIIFLIAVIFTVIHADEWKRKLPSEMKVISTECIQENSLSKESIERMKRLDYPNIEPLRKYLLCLVTKNGIFNEHQGYYADRVAAQFNLDMEGEEVLEVINGCIDKNEQKSSVEEWAYRGFKCFLENGKRD